MPNPDVTFFVDDTASAARALEVPEADFENGMNFGGSNACGIGINQGGGPVVGTPEQFTLLDQRELARDAQLSQSIGGFPYVDRSTIDQPSSGGVEGYDPEAVIRYGTLPTEAAKEAADPSIDGTVEIVDNSTLIDLAVGWTAPTP